MKEPRPGQPTARKALHSGDIASGQGRIYVCIRYRTTTKVLCRVQIMISLFSKLMDCHVERQFGRDPSGRLVFIPSGPKGKYYFVDSKSDEEKIRAFVKMYRSSSAVISLLTTPSIVIAAMLLEDYGGLTPRAHRLTMAFGIAGFFWLVLILVALILWAAYRVNVQGLTSSLSEVGPEVKDQIRPASPPSRLQRRVAVVGLLAAVILMAGIVLAISSSGAVRHPSDTACPAPTSEE
jgi:hypothetical protein